MKFWDSSAIVPLLYEQPQSRACRQLIRADPKQTVRFFTHAEIVSAVCRLERDGDLDHDGARRAEATLDRLAARWTEGDSVLPVRNEAERLLRAHRLRAADACQLGAALVAFDGRPRRRSFASLDEALLDAARRERFDAIRPAAR